MTTLEKLKKENSVQEKSLNIIDRPEIIAKLKNKVEASPDKLKRMNDKWNKYEIEQKSILSELKEETNKKRVSTQINFYYKTHIQYFF